MIDYGFGVSLDIIDKICLDEIRNWRNDPQIWRWCRQNDLIYPENQEKWYHWQRDDLKTKMYSIKAYGNMDDIATGGFHDVSAGNTILLPVGVCGLTDIDLVNRRAEFSLYIAPQFQGKHMSKSALKTLFSYGFKELGLRSIWGETFDDNMAQNVFRAIGMKEDGMRRQFYFKAGKFCDAILFSMLDTEFKELAWTPSEKAS